MIEAKVVTSGFRGNTTVFRILYSFHMILTCLADCLLSLTTKACRVASPCGSWKECRVDKEKSVRILHK